MRHIKPFNESSKYSKIEDDLKNMAADLISEGFRVDTIELSKDRDSNRNHIKPHLMIYPKPKGDFLLGISRSTESMSQDPNVNSDMFDIFQMTDELLERICSFGYAICYRDVYVSRTGNRMYFAFEEINKKP